MISATSTKDTLSRIKNLKWSYWWTIVTLGLIVHISGYICQSVAIYIAGLGTDHRWRISSSSHLSPQGISRKTEIRTVQNHILDHRAKLPPTVGDSSDDQLPSCNKFSSNQQSRPHHPRLLTHRSSHRVRCPSFGLHARIRLGG